MTHTVTRWAISLRPLTQRGERERGLYVGQYLTRKDAIREHAEAYLGPSREDKEYRAKWKLQYARGDRAVKVQITWEEQE
jgi:hypothetical protein